MVRNFGLMENEISHCSHFRICEDFTPHIFVISLMFHNRIGVLRNRGIGGLNFVNFDVKTLFIDKEGVGGY